MTRQTKISQSRAFFVTENFRQRQMVLTVAKPTPIRNAFTRLGEILATAAKSVLG